jgi:MFS family permease
MFFNIAVGISTLIFGIWLEKVAFPLNYQLMFLGAFLLSMMSLWHVNSVRVLHPEPAATPDRPAIKPWRSAGFMRSAFIIILTYGSLFMIVPIIRLHLVDEMGADEAFMSYFSIAELSSAALVAMQINRIVRRVGNLRVISLGMVGTALAALIIALAPSLYITLFGAALGGATWTACAICIFGFFSENTPAESVTRYSMLFNQVVGLSMFVGPMLGSWLADTSLSLVAVLLIGAGLRLAAGALTLYHPFKHIGSRPAETIAVTID